ncbi:MAG: valine--tRNA ligase [Pirellulaceae bacterium]|nr:valine--tRNA ligase [Pirellulaceae bacterium]
MSTITEIPNRFDFESAQPRLYDAWVKQGFFHAEPDPKRLPYCIVIPPPNVTGALHLGHALNNTLQDVMIRLKRMQDFNTLWMPGTDHAGIATQAVVERRLKETENKTRHDLGREELVRRIWSWKDEYEQRILGQLQRLGASCDWERTRFTLDEQCARAVRHTFFDLFRKGLIYRGKRLVNWDTFLQTAVSDDEVQNETVQGHFWHLRYPVIDPKPGEPEFVIVATTRPETMLGDTAVAVHPDPAAELEKIERELIERLSKAPTSERPQLESQLEALRERRLTHLPNLQLLAQMTQNGRRLRVPLLGREIPLVTDHWPKPELGSGCVKITPAHDPNDYEVGKRCNLEMINILNPDGTLNAEAGPYAGLFLKQARQRVVADLEAAGLLDRVEEREIELPVSDRSKTPIEPYLADQWFVKMDTLAQSAMDAVRDGRVKIEPQRFERTYLDWLGEKRDWPVSRQLWWGHQIPVWSQVALTDTDAESLAANIRELPGFAEDRVYLQLELTEETDPERRQRLNLPYAVLHVAIRDEHNEFADPLEAMGFVRQEDVLDTWFSSALWPHSTLGWPDETSELKYFYPTNTLITSRDIISLWVARMVLMGLNNVGQIPFDRVFIHPKILDQFGETMSKSKGNGIDPLDVIDRFGADALRFAMVHLTTDTQDVRMPVLFECPHCEHRIEQTKKNRVLPRVDCPACKQTFSTQWATSDEDKALKRGAVISERFEVARNFSNKLWNAARFAMLRLENFEPGPVDVEQLTIEDRWILSRLVTVIDEASTAYEQFAYSEVARVLYDFAWQDFCSFYVEMLKERLSNDGTRIQAQRMLAFVLDQLLRLLHPVMPFVTEEIWQLLRGIAPQRGLQSVQAPSDWLIVAEWPKLDNQWRQPQIESQFRLFESALGALREIRAKQKIEHRREVKFSVRCNEETAGLVRAMEVYFASMANARLTAVGPEVSPPKPSATLAIPEMELYVDLAGLIDTAAEKVRLEKEQARLQQQITGTESKLANPAFVEKAPPDVIARFREQLAQNVEQLAAVQQALKDLE